MDRSQNMVEPEMSGDLDDFVDFLNLRVSTQTMGIGLTYLCCNGPKYDGIPVTELLMCLMIP
jgi:hypothetical protein